MMPLSVVNDLASLLRFAERKLVLNQTGFAALLAHVPLFVLAVLRSMWLDEHSWLHIVE
jgi:hypothetical protein